VSKKFFFSAPRLQWITWEIEADSLEEAKGKVLRRDGKQLNVNEEVENDELDEYFGIEEVDEE